MNFSFQFVCSTQIKIYQESGCWGAFLVLCTAGSLELPGALCPGPTGGLTAAPTQPAAPGNEIRSLDIVLSAGYYCHPCPHDKFGPPLLIPLKQACSEVKELPKPV